MGLCCTASRALIHRQSSRDRLWAVLEFCYVGKNCRASILRSKFHFRLGKFPGTGEKKELRSDKQEEEHIDGAG